MFDVLVPLLVSIGLVELTLNWFSDTKPYINWLNQIIAAMYPLLNKKPVQCWALTGSSVLFLLLKALELFYKSDTALSDMNLKN